MSLIQIRFKMCLNMTKKFFKKIIFFLTKFDKFLSSLPLFINNCYPKQYWKKPMVLKTSAACFFINDLQQIYSYEQNGVGMGSLESCILFVVKKLLLEDSCLVVWMIFQYMNCVKSTFWKLRLKLKKFIAFFFPQLFIYVIFLPF